MKVIPPLALTDALVTSSTAAEPGIGETTWTAGATFALGERCIVGNPSAGVTITNASPGVVTYTAHGLPKGTPGRLTTTGTLPAGLVVGTLYYLVAPLVDTFQLSAVLDGAPIVTTSGGTGTHTFTAQVHRKYESLQAANLGKNPTLASSSTWWTDIGPTNKWAMFDLLRNTTTILASPLTVVLTPGQRINSIALLGLVANSVTILATSVVGGGTVFNTTYNLDTRNVLDWYSFFFEPFSTNPNVTSFDIPPFSDVIITITMTATSGNVECGACIIGTSVFLGDAQYNAVSDCINFSTVTRDVYGNSTLVPRRNVPKVSLRVFMDKSRVNKVIAVRDALNAVPALFSGVDDSADGYSNALLTLAVIKLAPISLDYPLHAIMNLELEEV